MTAAPSPDRATPRATACPREDHRRAVHSREISTASTAVPAASTPQSSAPALRSPLPRYPPPRQRPVTCCCRFFQYFLDFCINGIRQDGFFSFDSELHYFQTAHSSPFCIPELSPRRGDTTLGLPTHLLGDVWGASSFWLLQIEPW